MRLVRKTLCENLIELPEAKNALKIGVFLKKTAKVKQTAQNANDLLPSFTTYGSFV